MLWKLEDLLRSAPLTGVRLGGRLVPARPINSQHEGLGARVRDAWLVLTGKAEAFTWPENQ